MMLYVLTCTSATNVSILIMISPESITQSATMPSTTKAKTRSNAKMTKMIQALIWEICPSTFVIVIENLRTVYLKTTSNVSTAINQNAWTTAGRLRTVSIEKL